MAPVEAALGGIPQLTVSRQDAAMLKRGQPILLKGRNAPILKGSVYALSDGVLVAIGEVHRGELQPLRVFNL